MELTTVKESFDRVAKKQKLSTSKSQEVIDQVGHEIEQALANIQSVHDHTSAVDNKSVLTELKAKLSMIGPHGQLEGLQKELNISMGKYLRVLDKVFNPEISKACRNVDFEPQIVNQIIASHLYREGLFDIADCLINEAGEQEVISLKCQYMEMHKILEAVRAKNLAPALDWVSTHREQIRQTGSNLELNLHRLQFMEILQKKGKTEALHYARTYLAPYAPHHMDEFQKLMGCLVFAGKLDRSPYSDLMAPSHWEKLAEEMTRHFCSFLGQSYESALRVSVEAGFEALPTLLKLANVMAVNKQEWQTMKELPVEVDLGKKFQFHSLFVCPVSWDQSSEENPPMMLPCGHVLCKQSIMKLSKSGTKTFKCPYCPVEASVAVCRQLYF